MELTTCPNNVTGKHDIRNSWGSFRTTGKVGLCSFCLGTFRPHEAYSYYLGGHQLDENLKLMLCGFGFNIEGYWFCASCGKPFSDDIDRLAHFNANH